MDSAFCFAAFSRDLALGGRILDYKSFSFQKLKQIERTDNTGQLLVVYYDKMMDFMLWRKIKIGQ